MHFAYAARLIARKLPVILLLGLLGLGGGYLASQLMQSYTTTAYLSMTPSVANQGVRAVDPERFFQTKSQLLVADDVMAASAKALGNGTSPAELRDAIELGGGATDDVLQLNVSGSTPAESQVRANAVLKGIQIASPKDEIATSLLWKTAPTAAVNRPQLLLGGLLGGLLVGALGVVLTGAVRRPVLDPQFVQVGSGRLSVYPRRISADEALSLHSGAVSGWLNAHNPDRLPMVVVPVARHSTGAVLEASTGAGELRTSGRFLVYLAPAPNSTEAAIEQTVSEVQGPADVAVLLVTEGAASHQTPVVTRRAAVSQNNNH